MSVRICFFGTYVTGGGYPVNTVLLKGLRMAGATVFECREPLWEGFLHQVPGGGMGGLLRLVGRALYRYGRLLWRYGRAGAHEVVVVGYPGYVDVLLARLLNAFSGRLLVLVSFISLYDTAVLDRGRLRPGTLRARLLYGLDRLAFASADWVLVDTQAQAAHYAQLFKLPLGKFRKSLVGNVFDEFKPGPPHRPGRSFRVLFFGTYVPLHGVEYIVEAAGYLRGETIEFELVGQGQLYEDVRARAVAAGLERVRFQAAWYSPEQLAAAMRGADVCLGIFGTTAKAARVIPYKVFAALALARPVISRDSPAIRELLLDGESALLCRPGDGADLARAIERLRAEPELARRLARAGHARYRERASTAAIGRHFYQALERDHAA